MLNNLYRENEVNYVLKRRLTAIGPFYSVPLTAIGWSLLVKMSAYLHGFLASVFFEGAILRV